MKTKTFFSLITLTLLTSISSSAFAAGDEDKRSLSPRPSSPMHVDEDAIDYSGLTPTQVRTIENVVGRLNSEGNQDRRKALIEAYRRKNTGKLNPHVIAYGEESSGSISVEEDVAGGLLLLSDIVPDSGGGGGGGGSSSPKDKEGDDAGSGVGPSGGRLSDKDISETTVRTATRSRDDETTLEPTDPYQVLVTLISKGRATVNLHRSTTFDDDLIASIAILYKNRKEIKELVDKECAKMGIHNTSKNFYEILGTSKSSFLKILRNINEALGETKALQKNVPACFTKEQLEGLFYKTQNRLTKRNSRQLKRTYSQMNSPASDHRLSSGGGGGGGGSSSSAASQIDELEKPAAKKQKGLDGDSIPTRDPQMAAHLQAFIRAGELFLKAGLYQEALSAYTKALEIHELVGNDRAGTLYLKGFLLSELSQHKAALAAFEEALAIPDCSEEMKAQILKGFISVGDSFLKVRLYQEALNAYTKALAFPECIGILGAQLLGAQLFAHKALTHSRLGQHEDALAAYERALEIHEFDGIDRAIALSNKGFSHASLRQHEAAIAAFAAAHAIPECSEELKAKILKGLADSTAALQKPAERD